MDTLKCDGSAQSWLNAIVKTGATKSTYEDTGNLRVLFTKVKKISDLISDYVFLM